MRSNEYAGRQPLPVTGNEDVRATLSVGKGTRAVEQSLLVESHSPVNLALISISVASDMDAETALPVETAPAARSGKPASGRGIERERPKRAAFVLTKPVGIGGHGEVHEALQTSLGRIVAVKRIRDEVYRSHGNNREAARLVEADFQQEALVAGALEHPNIVPVHDFGTDDNGRPLLAMKLIRGKSWDALIAEEWNSGKSQTEFLIRNLRILVDVAQAVAFAHSRGIVHRDLKPSQVMVGEFGETVLMDWGLAIFYGSSAHHFSLAQHTLAQVLPTPATASNPAGTPAFMAPEQTRESAQDIGPWTDVFLLGATLYYILTGTTPFACETVVRTMEKASDCEFDPPQVRASDREIPVELGQLCLRCMMKRPEDRLGSATHFIREISSYLSGSSKRTESTAITDAMRGATIDPSLGYKGFAEALAQLANARGLWDQNDEVTPQMDIILKQYSRMALAHRDLSLAAAQISLISNDETRESLQAILAEEETAVARQKRAASYFQYSSIVLLVVLLFIGFSNRGVEGSVSRLGEELARLIELEGNLRRLDESMTMSAMMAVATGESTWAERHAGFAEQFNAALYEMANRRTRAGIAYPLESIRALDETMTKFERRAFELAAEDKSAEARELLDTAEYHTAKQEFNAEVGHLFLNTQQAVTNLIEREEKVRRNSGNAVLGVVFLTALLWAYQIGLAHQLTKIRDHALRAIER